MNKQDYFPLLTLAVFASLVLSFSLLLSEDFVQSEEVTKEQAWIADECAKDNLEDSFPDLIVERALVRVGISASYIPSINSALDESTDTHLEKLTEDEEQVEGPLALQMAMEEGNHARFTIFATVMNEYMDDAAVMTNSFNEITEQRKELIEKCLTQNSEE